MKRIALLALLPIAIPLTLSSYALNPSTSAQAALIMNAKTGAVLWEKNGFAINYPASTTKIATALYVLEKKGEHLDEMVTTPREAVLTLTHGERLSGRYEDRTYLLDPQSCHIGLKPGEVMSLRNLLEACLVASADDACNVMAIHCSGTVPRFMEELNQRLREWGCKSTYFTNPHGLEHPKHKSTAYDLALMARVAMRNPTFRQMVKMSVATRPTTNMQATCALPQTNHLVRPKKSHYYPKAIGVKTGWIGRAGSCLVAEAVDGDRDLIVVVLGCKTGAMRFDDAITLFDAAFAEELVERTLIGAGPQTLTQKVAGAAGLLKTETDRSLSIRYYPSEAPSLSGSVVWSSLTPPIKRGSVVASLRAIDENGEVVAEVPLLAAADLDAGLVLKLTRLWQSHLIIRIALPAVVIGALSVALYFLLRRSHIRRVV